MATTEKTQKVSFEFIGIGDRFIDTQIGYGTTKYIRVGELKEMTIGTNLFFKMECEILETTGTFYKAGDRRAVYCRKIRNTGKVVTKLMP